jgi:hypothetical protein
MKKLLIALVICMVLSTMVGGVALAAGKGGAQQASFYPVASGSSDNVLTDQPSQGKAIINNPKGNVTLIIEGNVEGLEANHFYTVWVRDIGSGYTGESYNSYLPLGYFLIGYFTTDEYGEGNFHINVRAADLQANTYDIQVAINNAPSVAEIGYTVLATVKYTTVTVGK